MKLWFARKYGMMPVRFFFEKSSIFPLEKLTEFTDYKPIGDSGIYFPRKIVSKSKLYSKDSPNYEGTSEISISINSIELNPAPSVFSHFPVPGELVIDISKKTTYVHYPDSNLFFENGIMEAQQRLRLSVSTSSFSTHWAIGSFLLTCFIVCLIVFIRRRASIA
jgi:hypothetical protein